MVYKAMTPFKAGKQTLPAGSFVIQGDEALLKSLADEYGLEFTGLMAKPEVQLTKIHLPKVGLYKS